MPHRQNPDSVRAVTAVLTTARDMYLETTNPALRAIGADLYAKLDTTVETSVLSRLLKEGADVQIALAGQAPLSNIVDKGGALLAKYISHFHQVLDLGIDRGAFAVGARSFYGREVTASALPPLSTYQQLLDAADAIVNGEARRAAAEATGAAFYDRGVKFDSGATYDTPAKPHIPMALPSAAEVGAVRDRFKTLFSQSRQAQANTDIQREELLALYNEARAVAIDVCDTVEFFYRKDPDASSRREKAARWGVPYVFDDNEQPPATTTPTTTPATTTTTPATPA